MNAFLILEDGLTAYVNDKLYILPVSHARFEEAKLAVAEERYDDVISILADEKPDSQKTIDI